VLYCQHDYNATRGPIKLQREKVTFTLGFKQPCRLFGLDWSCLPSTDVSSSVTIQFKSVTVTELGRVVRRRKTYLHRMLFMNEFRLAVHLSRASNFHDAVVHGTTIDTSLKWYKTGI